MTPRWWRVGVILERDGDPWTWTFHVRAPTEKSARALVAGHIGEESFTVHVCHPSDPLLHVANREEIAAHYGPYRRSWEDPAMAQWRDR